MLLLARLMMGVAWALDQILYFFTFVIIARVVVSWVNADPYNPLVRAISALSDPPTKLVKRYIPTTFGGIDLSPMILILVIGFLQFVLTQNLRDYAIVMLTEAFQGTSLAVGKPSL